MKPERAGYNWVKAEETILRLLFLLRYSCEEMAKVHKRSVGSILAKSVELDLVEMEVLIDARVRRHYLKGTDVLFHEELNVYTRCYRQDVRRKK